MVATNPDLQRLCAEVPGTVDSVANTTFNVTASSVVDGLSPCDQAKVELALLIAFMAGLIMVSGRYVHCSLDTYVHTRT